MYTENMKCATGHMLCLSQHILQIHFSYCALKCVFSKFSLQKINKILCNSPQFKQLKTIKSQKRLVNSLDIKALDL